MTEHKIGHGGNLGEKKVTDNPHSRNLHSHTLGYSGLSSTCYKEQPSARNGQVSTARRNFPSLKGICPAMYAEACGVWFC